jgi:hypothetical protein
MSWLNTNQIQFQRNVEAGGCQYQVSVASAKDTDGSIVIDVLGAGPGGESTQGTLTVSITALPHLGSLLAEVLGGVAAACGITVEPAAAPARRRSDPANSGQPWTDELRATLRERWLRADPAAKPTKVINAIAAEMGRSFESIRSALQKLHLDPDQPGQEWTSSPPLQVRTDER